MYKKILQLVWPLVLKIIKHRLMVKYHQFLKYCIGGGLAFIIDVGFLYIFTEFCGIWYLLSATLSFTIAAIFNYSFQKFVTFKDTNKQYGKQFILFVIIALVGLGINNSLLYVQVEYLGIWYILSKGIAAGFVLIWNFFANKYITFKKNDPPPITL